MNDAAVVDWNPPTPAVTYSPLWVAAKPGYELYWRWNDLRWGAWGETPERMRYPINDLWEKLIQRAGYTGEVYKPWTYTVVNEWGFAEDVQGGLTYTDAAKAAIDALRARGFDLARKHPDRRTYNTYWGLFTPDGGVQDIKIEGDDGAGNLLKIAMFMAPVWSGPLAALLNVPAPVVSAGFKLATGADPGKVLVSTLAPIAVETVLPSINAFPDASIGPILPAEEWLDAPFVGPVLPTMTEIDPGFVIPTLPISTDTVAAADLLTAPALLPDLDPVETMGPIIEPPATVQVEAEPISEGDEMTTWQERAAAMRARFERSATEPVEALAAPIDALPEPATISEPVAPPPEPIVYRGEPFWRQWGIVNPFAADPYAPETPAPVVEQPAASIPIEPEPEVTMPDYIPEFDEIDLGGLTFEIDPLELPTGLWDVVPAIDVPPPMTVDQVSGWSDTVAPGLPDYPMDGIDNNVDSGLGYGMESTNDLLAGTDIEPLTYDTVASVEARDFVTASESAAAPTSNLPPPTREEWSLVGVINQATAAMVAAAGLVRAYQTLTAGGRPGVNPTAASRTATGGSVQARDDGLIWTRDAQGRVTSARPPTGLLQVTTTGNGIINNGDGTYTLIGQDGQRRTMRYPGGGMPSWYLWALIGGAALYLTR